MSNVQITVGGDSDAQVVSASLQETQITSAVPGIQGPVGPGVPSGGTTNQVMFKQSDTSYDTAWGNITSAMIGDLEIVNADVASGAAIELTKLANGTLPSGITIASANIIDGSIVNTDVNASAAIAGTKISPNFGSQNVTTTGTSTAASFTPTSSAIPSNGLYLPGTNQVAISTNGTGRLFVDASGNVGVGTGSPTSIGTNILSIHVKGTSGAGIAFGSTSFDQSLALFTSGDGAAGNLGTYANMPLVLTTNGTERLRITSGGLVGIGTSSPGRTLDVAGTARVSSVLIIGSYIQGTTQLDLYGDSSSSSGVRLDSSGRVGIGVTSPAYKLQLETDSAGKPSTNTWTIVSDERIKEEIELADLDLCYEAVKNIPLKRFKWKDEVYTEEQAYDRRKLGWIAQDVEAVFPKAVRQHEFKYNQVFEEVVIPAVPAELDDDGNVITEEQPERIEKGELISEEVIEDCRDLNSDQLYAAMYGAIQKLISKVELLEAEVQALKAA